MNTIEYEKAFWGDCLNTFGEEKKQLVYAELMGIDFDLRGRGVLDLGGGPVSILLKCRNRGFRCTVADPMEMPRWVRSRYDTAGIFTFFKGAESWLEHEYAVFQCAEIWMYNVLQHVENPEKIISGIKRHPGKLFRFFDWCDTPVYEGHPHSISVADWQRWFPNDTIHWGHIDKDGASGMAAWGVIEIK